MYTENKIESPIATKRNSGFDVLKIIATFAVIVIHTAGYMWEKIDCATFEWNVFTVYDSMVRWAVPVFVMISGALFLNAENSIKKLFGKYILRIAAAFICWSFGYAVLNYIVNRNITQAAREFILGHYHMWFLYMIAGLYMITPILKKLVENKKLTRYFLILSFIFFFAFNEIISVAGIFSKEAADLISSVQSSFHLDYLAGYTFYYILGYCISKVQITKKQMKAIALCGALGFAATMGLTLFASHRAGAVYKAFFGDITANVAFEAVFVFSLCSLINKHSFSQKAEKALKILAKFSFGAYLVHPLFLNVFERFLHLTTLSFNPILSVPLIALAAFAGSFAVSAVINQIPVLKKYIV